MIALKAGDDAPKFSLLNQDGKVLRLEDFRGKNVVLYFYPKALTPGCTTQACGMRDATADLRALDAIALGVSPDPLTKLQKFKEKHALNFDLLSDEGHAVADSYGVWDLKKFMGKSFMGVVRTTFIIDPAGRIACIVDKFSTSSHHQVVIEWLKKISLSPRVSC